MARTNDPCNASRLHAPCSAHPVACNRRRHYTECTWMIRVMPSAIGGARRRCSLVTGDFRIFRVPSGRAARRGSVGVLSRSMFERPDVSGARVLRRPDRTLAGGFKRDVGCLFFGYVNQIREANAYEISRTAVRVRGNDNLFRTYLMTFKFTKWHFLFFCTNLRCYIQQVSDKHRLSEPVDWTHEHRFFHTSHHGGR